MQASAEKLANAETATNAETSAHKGAPAKVAVVGAGLAGSEAAWQLAERGVSVKLYEMRPKQSSPAHKSEQCAELVCSNSFKSLNPHSAAGCLKAELAAMGSFVLRCATKTQVPAGSALAVDRERFAAEVTAALRAHPNIELITHEIQSLTEVQADNCAYTIVATGPLTSDAFAAHLAQILGESYLSFYDAAAPIVSADSLDYQTLFAQSRYNKGSVDYLNAPFDQASYDAFIGELVAAERVIKRDFEKKELFAACQPVEEVARLSADALRFGALKPVGLTNPATERRPWAAVQLRAENSERSAYNLVGFQTNLTFSEQERVFRLIPGLEQAEFLRFGVMHRNTFVNAPLALGHSFELHKNPTVFLAGQLTGTEGYTEAIASGLLAALNVYARLTGAAPVTLPPKTCFGALVNYATNPQTVDYQPMHVNFGIMPALETPIRNKRQRYEAYAERSRLALKEFIEQRSELAFLPAFEFLVDEMASPQGLSANEAEHE
ncbi:MAG: methylenetetrahydrofolate--tRNA-(uracil(54)-C(5))-methyltransferase (FADH(2)-oxidizing) TrmFO [Coriobacteriia bacterium]|nr:methylenetetrahydrofolate--tRNA-(uracil(54)-C(5))-methyltransferase (FADH(2)-oxidizing) TrmFO [Coriobacteriia bacterium]